MKFGLWTHQQNVKVTVTLRFTILLYIFLFAVCPRIPAVSLSPSGDHIYFVCLPAISRHRWWMALRLMLLEFDCQGLVICHPGEGKLNLSFRCNMVSPGNAPHRGNNTWSGAGFSPTTCHLSASVKILASVWDREGLTKCVLTQKGARQIVMFGCFYHFRVELCRLGSKCLWLRKCGTSRMVCLWKVFRVNQDACALLIRQR